MSVCLFVCLSVCLSVCLLTYISRKPHDQTSPYFLCMLPAAEAGSSSDGIAILMYFWFWDNVIFIPQGQWTRINHDIMFKSSAGGSTDWTSDNKYLVEFIRIWLWRQVCHQCVRCYGMYCAYVCFDKKLLFDKLTNLCLNITFCG